jgi:hypothetical protein
MKGGSQTGAHISYSRYPLFTKRRRDPSIVRLGRDAATICQVRRGGMKLYSHFRQGNLGI